MACFHGINLGALLDHYWYEIQLGDLFFFIMKKGDAYWSTNAYQGTIEPPMMQPLKLINALPNGMEVKEKIYLREDADAPLVSLQLADKPYQVNPAAEVKIEPKSRLVLYVSTPLWLQFKSGDGKVLVEYPTVVPRLSWVGTNTTEGSLCYSTKTSAPSIFSEVKHYKHRALTALELINDGDKLLTIDRLSLPLNILGLYYTANSGYWTESVRYRINPDTGDTTVVSAQRPPEELGDVTIIAKARTANKTSRFRTAMNLIMG